MNLLRNGWAWAGLALASVPAFAQPAPRRLPVEDQIAIYAATLRAATSVRHPSDESLRLLLNPVTVIRELKDHFLRSRSGSTLDTAVVRGLLRAGVVDALCLPGRDHGHCANGERGLGVRVSEIQLWPSDSTRAMVDVETQIVQAERDNVLIIGGPPAWTRWTLARVDGQWRTTLSLLQPNP